MATIFLCLSFYSIFLHPTQTFLVILLLSALFFLLYLSSSYSIFLFLSLSFFFPVYLSTWYANFLPFLSYSYVISISAIVNQLLTEYYGHNASNGDELPVSNQGPDEGDVGGAKGRAKCQNGTEHAPRVTR